MQVEIWSDVVCPWCYIGKRRFEDALARFAHADEVDVVWRSFELDPNAPTSGTVDLVGRLASKYGVSRDEAEAMNERVSRIADDEGLDFRLDIARPGRTFDAHRLIHLGAARGRQDEVKEAVLAAYQTQGRAIADPDVLVDMAVAAGLDEDEVREVLGGDRYAADVRADEREAGELGVSGVPFFVLDRRYAVSGAQASDVLLAALEQAWGDRSPLV
ncbi:MAG: DsbA family oxidoreductase, partial [Actinomycetota bacterium]|nr:DsbA family oxidoreductase [Actinomycetota bacterium]